MLGIGVISMLGIGITSMPAHCYLVDLDTIDIDEMLTLSASPLLKLMIELYFWTLGSYDPFATALDSGRGKPGGRMMKSLSVAEVAQIAISLQSMVGAHLQDALQTSSEVGLGFYGDRGTTWLWLDLHPQRPVLIRIAGRAPKRKKLMRPLTLFLRANFFGRRLQSVRADLEQGRVLVLTFSRSTAEQVENPGPCELEMRLFPRGQNLLARCGKKSIAESKPKELASGAQTSFGEADRRGVDSIESRTWEEIEAQWQAEQAPAVPAPDRESDSVSVLPSSPSLSGAAQEAARLVREWQKAIDKKKKALDRMREDIENKMRDAQVFRQLGEWLKAHASEGRGSQAWFSELEPEYRRTAPPEFHEAWAARLKGDESLAWNIENSFTKAKDGARKIGGTQERFHLVERELAALISKGAGSFDKKRDQDKQKSANDLLAKSDARGRRLALGEGLDVYIGKSAADNLALLRRAQPFDYWLHLRDQPGSHAILRRGRQRLVTDLEFQEAGRWVIEQSLGSRATESRGERFDLLIVECRFVRPIKGDRLGRVNYSNDRVMSLRY